MASKRHQPASLREAYKFFLPLMLTAELMMISHAVITAFLARMADPEPILAAYSIAFYLHATLGSPVWACHIVVLSYAKDRAAMRRLLGFSLQAMATVGWAWLLVAATPVGNWLFEGLFRASPPVAEAAKRCVAVSFLVIPFVAVRSLAYGLLMVSRRTMLVTYGTVIRLVALAGLLAVITLRFEGAVVGMLGLAGCIAIETVYAVLVARRFYRDLPERSAGLPTYRALWRFSWPIMLMLAAESGVAFSVNFVLGRLVRPELALAAFGVLDSLLRVLLSPLRNLVHTAQTLVSTRADMRVMLVFTLHALVAFGGLMLLFHLPWVRDLVLRRVMGLPPELAEYITPALRLGALLAVCTAAAGIARGLVIATRRTGAIAVSSGMRIAAVVLVGAMSIALGVENGALVGIGTLIAAFGLEAAILAGLLVRLDRGRPRLFEAAGERDG